MTFESRSPGEGTSHVYDWGESVSRRNGQCEGLSLPGISEEQPRGHCGQGRHVMGVCVCVAMQGCSSGFGFAPRDMEVYKLHHTHRVS